MLLTESADLNELFVELFGNRALERIDDGSHDSELHTSASDSYLESPMSALVAPAGSLAEVYGDDGNLLANLAEIAARQGEPSFAELLVELAKIVSNEKLYIESEPMRSRRLVEYVYPVV